MCMTIRDFVKELLNHNLNGQVTIQYPNSDQYENNYCAWKEVAEFDIVECAQGIIIGIKDEDK